MIKISGASDDVIEVGGDLSAEFGYTHADEGELIGVSDGTLLRVRLDEQGVWRITPVVRGACGPDLVIVQATEDERTDVATLPGAVWVMHGTSMVKVPRCAGVVPA